MLHLTFSNKFETLRDALLENLGGDALAPFSSEEIIVPSAAIRRQLTLSIADRTGICANVQFSFLAQWLWRQIGQFVPSVAEESPFASSVLAWRIFGIFDEAKFLDDHPRLADYLHQADPVMRFDLATRTAGLLEQYLTYRPDWLKLWLDGKLADLGQGDDAQEADQRWQAALWRRIVAELGTGHQHPATTFLQTVAEIGKMGEGVLGKATALPASAHIFCLPTIPPLYIDILRELGRWIDLRFYVLNPCQEYWFEIVDRQRLSYLQLQGKADYHEQGNPLLAHWGQQTQAAIDLLVSSTEASCVDEGRFVPSEGNSLLALVQNAVLNLTDPAPLSMAMAEDDRSLEVHVCHSLTRELEVLQNQLLTLLAGPNPPLPCDILVVTPDLEAAAPLIDAVFGNTPKHRTIPFTISGRPRSTVNEAARALLALLTLVTSRFKASDVFDLLQQPIVGRRFGIIGDELETVREWMNQSAMRWGVDGAHRTRYGLPEVERYSFADGLQRLFLGYALPAGLGEPFDGRLPAGNPAGTGAVVLGSLWHFIEQLMRLRTLFTTPKASGEWMEALAAILDDFLQPSDKELEDCGEVRTAVRELHANMARGGMTVPVPLEVVRAALTSLLDDPARGGVPTGAVTFAATPSLRTLPYRIVCAIGLNDGDFPSVTRPTEFDLMALVPRRGDRQRRHDERNLFLDLLLAARERLILSYTGRSVRDNSIRPASVLIAELLEYLCKIIAADATPSALEAARNRLVVEHPLQPFAVGCFTEAGDPRRRSFNEEYCAALQAGLQHPIPAAVETSLPDAPASPDDDEDPDTATETQPRFFLETLVAPEGEWRTVTLDQLMKFLKNPCKYLLKERLGIGLDAADDEIKDDEPFLPEFLDRGKLAERLLPHLLAGRAVNEIRSLAQAGTEYPTGSFGDLLLNNEIQLLQEFAGEVRQATAVPCALPHHAAFDFEIAGETWRLEGSLGDLRASGLVRYRYDDTRPVDYLSAWLAHLFLCAASPENIEKETIWYSRDGQFRLTPCATARETLHALMDLYRQGLSSPLHFFPKSSWACTLDGGSIKKAMAKWKNARNPEWGESSDLYYSLALRGVTDPLDEAFMANSQTVFAPLIAGLVDARL